MFVHSRNGTVKTATILKEMASASGESVIFTPDQSPELGAAQKQVIDFLLSACILLELFFCLCRLIMLVINH